MSKILLLGMGPLPDEPSTELHAPGLRTWQLLRPLLDDGHEVEVLCLVGGPGPGAPRRVEGPRLSRTAFDPRQREHLAFVQQVHDRMQPDAIVGVNVPAAAVACGLDTTVPVWADLNGHYLAEAQVKALVFDDDNLLYAYWEAERGVLDRADAFSAVSRAQALATVGELGTRGRLNRHSAGYEFVQVIPNAIVPLPVSTESDPALRGARVPADAFIVLWTGGYNTWTDVDTLYAGLIAAMEADPRLAFVSTGGAIAGHDERTYARFRALVDGGPHQDRFLLEGWVPTAALPAYYAAADLAINVDRVGYEGLLGARTRMLHWLDRAMPIATTVTCELAAELVERDLAFAFPPEDPAALGKLLRRLAADPGGTRARGVAGQSYARARFSPARVAAPLLAWARAPGPAPDRGRRLPLERHAEPGAGGVAGPSSGRGRLGARAPTFAVSFVTWEVPRRLAAGSEGEAWLVLRNQGTATWPAALTHDKNPVNLAYHWRRQDGTMLVEDGLRTPLPHSVRAGDTVLVRARVLAPPERGQLVLEWDLVREGVAWFGRTGGRTLVLPVEVGP